MPSRIFIRPLRVLDLAALKQVLVRQSYFDPDCRLLLERAAFLERLSTLMTRPVMPEYEHTDYLVTQVIADYLASEHRLDGMIYPSVQVREGVNVVLFHRACRIESMELPQGTAIRADRESWDDDGPGRDFLVVEEVPVTCVPDTKKPQEPDFDLAVTMATDFSPSCGDWRYPSLRILQDEIAVHRVTFVEYGSEKSAVRRQRRTRADAEADSPV